MTKKIATSPERHTFQARNREGDVWDEILENIRKGDADKLEDPKWQEYNLEYDLRTADWVVEKCKNKFYAQHLYAALCNNDFAKFTHTGDRIETYRNLREEYWSCSWRYAGGVVAHLRGEGDYIDWYCSGIRNDGYQDDLDIPGEDQHVSEGGVTDEIRADLAKLGWVVIQSS